MDKRVIFLYDELMTSKVQKTARLDLSFISFARVRAVMYTTGDMIKRRYLVLPNDNNLLKRNKPRITYGALFYINKPDGFDLRVHSFYNSSIPFTDRTLNTDIYAPMTMKAEPIKFDTIEQIETCNYEVLTAIDAIIFVGNESNEANKKRVSHRNRKIVSNTDTLSLLTLIKEVNSGKIKRL